MATYTKNRRKQKKQFNAFEERYWRLKKNYVYRVIPFATNSTKTSNPSKNELVQIIADALLGEPYAVQLVARFGDDNLEMEKDWELMSELDKDELWIIVNKVDKKLDRGEKFRFKIIRGKKIDGRMRTRWIVKSVNILKQGNL